MPYNGMSRLSLSSLYASKAYLNDIQLATVRPVCSFSPEGGPNTIPLRHVANVDDRGVGRVHLLGVDAYGFTTTAAALELAPRVCTHDEAIRAGVGEVGLCSAVAADVSVW